LIDKGHNEVLYYLHPEHLGGNLFATDTGGVKSSVQGYYAYGKTRWGTLQTDHRFTGQKYDNTGLYYFNARYYDPQIGAFISPRPVGPRLVPDPTNLWDYNRFAYARLNPLKYNDPTGHQACDTEWCWQNRWYNAHGYFWDRATGHWSRQQDPVFADPDILTETMREAGIEFDATSPWLREQMEAIATGVVRLSHALTHGMNRLQELLGPGARMYLSQRPRWCLGAPACALPPRLVDGRYPVHFDSEQIGDLGLQGLTYTAVHELGHVMDWHSGRAFSNNWRQPPLTNYAACEACLRTRERWAEAVTYFVFGEAYASRDDQDAGRGVVMSRRDIQLQVDLINAWLNP
jgi:RHS repeat-associated protein